MKEHEPPKTEWDKQSPKFDFVVPLIVVGLVFALIVWLIYSKASRDMENESVNNLGTQQAENRAPR